MEPPIFLFRLPRNYARVFLGWKGWVGKLWCYFPVLMLMTNIRVWTVRVCKDLTIPSRCSPVTTSLSVAPYDDFAHSIVDHAWRYASRLILLPWLTPTAPTVADTFDTRTGGSSTSPTIATREQKLQNPFDAPFDCVSGGKTDKSPSDIHSLLIRGVFAQRKTDIALFIDAGDPSAARLGGSLHVFFPFFGGPDDSLALDFLVQLYLNPRTTATVVRVVKQEGVADAGEGLERPSYPEDKVDARGLTPHSDGPMLTSVRVVRLGLCSAG